jgi:hypothetical protein
MSVNPELVYEPVLSIEQELFGAVEQIIATDGPYLMQHEGVKMPKWIAAHGKVTLSEITLTSPITKPGFKVLSANIEVGYPGMESAISIHREDPEMTGHEYDGDFIAHDVLSGLNHYINHHPHSRCIRVFRLIRSREYGLPVDLDEISIRETALL